MTTRPFVPRSNGEGGIGTSLKRWLSGYFNNLNVDTTATINTANITTANISTANIATGTTTAASIGTLNMTGAINQTLTTLASASTMNIGASAANYIIVTGTTTITAFDTIQAGVVRTLRFGGSLTITYNATTMLLPTATNIITAAGDVATFVSGGSGIWRCMDYQRYDGTALASSNKIAIINETQPNGTQGGTFTSGAWRTRTINTVIIDQIGVSLSSNRFSLPAGTYKIKAYAPAFYVDTHKARLQNITDSTTMAIGSNENAGAGGGYSTGSESTINTFISINSSKTFEIQHYCQTTRSTNGLGCTCTFGVSEIYTQVEIEKVG